MDNHQALIKQVLFYLSDENLAKDEFFYDKVAADPYFALNLVIILLISNVSLIATKLKNLATPSQINSYKQFRNQTSWSSMQKKIS